MSVQVAFQHLDFLYRDVRVVVVGPKINLLVDRCTTCYMKLLIV
jgi:hypothetical protein